MKARNNIVLIVLALLAYWLGLCNASAFYDPGQQRWLNRDPLGERGFHILRTAATMPKTESRGEISSMIWTKPDSLELYTFVGNAPGDYIDILGLEKDPGTLLDALWEATKSGADYVGEEASLLEIFGGCGGLGVVLAYAETQYNSCLTDALLGPACNNAAADAACKQKWSNKIAVLQDIQNKECKGKN